MSRTSSFSEEIADRICDLLAEGQSLVEICRRSGMPHRATVMRWMGKNADFAAKCARAREAQADYLFDELAQIETDVLAGVVPPDAARW